MRHPSSTDHQLNLSALRDKLSKASGKQFWRSLEELADSEEFLKFLHAEFPEPAQTLTDGVARREFLRLMGASLALAGLSACTKQPPEKIVPYVQQPEEIIPGKPLFFATSCPLSGFGTGVLVESHMGRPTKIEGNPDHPASLGATDSLTQASVLNLYDPDRSQSILQRGAFRTWTEFLAAFQSVLEIQRKQQGEGLRLLTGNVGSPTLAQQIKDTLARFPKARWCQYEPAQRTAAYEGARLAFGEPVEALYHFDKAEVVLSLESDFLGSGPGHVRAARDFTSRRHVDDENTKMNRLYVVESTPTLSGAMADHRLPMPASDILSLGYALARQLGVAGVPEPRGMEEHSGWIAALASDLKQNPGACLVVPGEHQPASLHALAHMLNQHLGNVGTTVTYNNPVLAQPGPASQSIQQLTQDMQAGRVQVLIILDGNPVVTAPSDVNFGEAMGKVGFRVHLSLFSDETSALSDWHVPSLHYLETWSDCRAYDGTAGIIQPLIEPLYSGRSSHELLAALNGEAGVTPHDLIHSHWQSRQPSPDFEKFWRKAVHDGVVEGSNPPPRTLALRPQIDLSPPPSQQDDSLELVFRLDASSYDGRFANNGWLQELPRPMSKLTWDNAAMISPALAERLNLRSGDVVEMEYREAKLEAPVWILPGQSRNTVTVHLGYGRERAGRVGNGVGFDAYKLRRLSAPWFDRGLKLRRLNRRHELVTTQHHFSLEGRNLLRTANIAEYRKEPDLIQEMGEKPAPDDTLYPGFDYPSYAWGMTIDLNVCTGCRACVAACQAENNIPVVGKEQVRMGREMQWIRIDRYYAGNLDAPETYHQPVPCMQCENAPCELVCPVGATNHSSEGLNDMVYNRCVGTRYCSNNCPYKVRRFNFLLFADYKDKVLELQRNPNVSVRTRGVMEKCTYCVQRINGARIKAEEEDRLIRDGEIQTACQAVCPTEAIVFGNINDPNSKVSKLKSQLRNYGMLAELNTRPRTTYLARFRNPNPEIEHE